MSLTDYRTLGRSGLRVSPFCLGAMTFGQEWGFGATVEDSYAVIDAYIARGGNFIDTANVYTHGHSEQIIGDHVGRIPARRDRVVLATKFMGNMYPGDPNGGGASRKAVRNACEQSLRRLQTDHIDLYLAHFWDRHTPIDEMMRAVDELVQAGKIRYFGFSDHPAWVCVMAQYEAIFRNWTPGVALQIEYSLIERTVENDLIPMARATGMGVTPWSPLKGGLLTGKYTRASLPKPGEARFKEDSKHLNDRNFAIIETLLAVAREVGCSPAQAALAWVRARPGVSSVIVGARTVLQLEDNLKALDIALTPDQSARLDHVSAPARVFPHEFLDLVQTAIQNGATINGVRSDAWPLSPRTDAQRW